MISTQKKESTFNWCVMKWFSGVCWMCNNVPARFAWCTADTLQWRHKEHDGVSNHRRLDCLHNRLFRRRSKKTSKLRVTGLCEGNSSVTGEFPAQRASNAENISIWWRHHDTMLRTAVCIKWNQLYHTLHAHITEQSILWSWWWLRVTWKKVTSVTFIRP